MPDTVSAAATPDSAGPAAAQPSPTNHRQKPVTTLVVDTNAFIKGLPVDAIASKFVTVPEVVHELRSRTSKDRFRDLDLKYGVQLLGPDAESLQAVREFARRTGDFASLSLADMRVVALAFMLEKRASGMERLRLEPVGDHPNIADRKLLRSAEMPRAARSQEVEPQLSEGVAPTEQKPEDDENLKDDVKPEDDVQPEDDVKPEDEGVAAQLEQMTLSDGEESVSVLQQVANDELEVGSDEEFEQAQSDDEGWEVAKAKPTRRAGAARADDFFGGGWITPRNVKQHQAADAMGMKHAQAAAAPAEPMPVACVTSDFAMQNVILKMGIRLVTPDGVVVQRLRTSVLRCHACFHLTGDMDRQFCSECGHATLRRCTVTTGANGRLHVHLKANYRNNLRGTVHTLPKPRGGRHTTRDVITREDERVYMNAIKYKKRVDAKSNAGMGGAGALDDPDFVPDLLVGSLLSHGNGYGVATDARGMPMVSRNRRNPNVVRTTGNRKKKSHN
ncbi:20S-pre-rRNA D-site endonuclease nob1 [Coemansia sp. RSA 2610]|nr:20S-pre-rRNA D-site endonuclease nob1 [Coemansia sp. RSA 2610]